MILRLVNEGMVKATLNREDRRARRRAEYETKNKRLAKAHLCGEKIPPRRDFDSGDDSEPKTHLVAYFPFKFYEECS